jgi:uncharacterized protein
MDGKPQAKVDDILQVVRPCLGGRPEIVFAYVFGSAARGEARSNSDVDIAVYLDSEPVAPGIGGYRAKLLSELMSCLRRNDVDLVILNQAPVVLQHRVLRDGIIILSHDDKRRVDFTVDTMRRYFDTGPLRALALEYMRQSIQDGTYGREIPYRTVVDPPQVPK